MSIKKLSHLHKAWKHRRGSCYAVLGYPRSGTTMLSEVVAMVTDYYFDRDNIFPSSSKVVLHTHWNPERFLPERAVCIVRRPLDVALSVLDYAELRGFPIGAPEALSARRICRIRWLDHVRAAQRAGHHIVDYDRFVQGDPGETERLAAHLDVPPGWIAKAMELLGAKHAQQPHASDAISAERKAARDPARLQALTEALVPAIRAETDLYRQIGSE